MSVFLRAYALARRVGVVDKPWFEGLFARSYFLYKRLVEDPFHGLARLRPELFRDGHIVDVGANIGYDSVVFARALSPGFRVLSLEPEAKNFAMLERSLARHRVADRVTPLRVAAGAVDGTIDIVRNPDHPGDHRVAAGRAGAETVPMRSVDSLVAEHLAGAVAFVKIDVQGYEPAVVEGMRRTLAQNPRIAVAFEYAPEGMRELGQDPDALLGLLAAEGFGLRRLEKSGRTTAAAPADLEAAVRARGYTDVLAMRSYSGSPHR